MNSLLPAAKQAVAAMANATATVSASIPPVDASGAVGGAGASASGSGSAKKTNRCHGQDCRKKLGILPLHCRCGHDFCSEHIGSSAHACTYDYKGENVKLLTERMDMKGLSVKLERI
jgi:hypothetical protein